MQFSSLFVSLVLATAASANAGVNHDCSRVNMMTRDSDLVANATKLAAHFHNNTNAINNFKTKVQKEQAELNKMKANSTLMTQCHVIDAHNAAMHQCRKVSMISHETEMVANATRLNQMFKNNQTRINDFKNKVQKDQAELNTMKANSTLMTICNVANAHAKIVGDCNAMNHMEKMAAIAGNNTKLAAQFKNNQTNMNRFKDQVSKNVARLTSFQHNATLTAFCSVQHTGSQCMSMKRMEKEITMANNATALNLRFHNNQTRVNQYKAHIAKVQTRLNSMKGNATLMNECQKMTQQRATTGAATNGTTTKPKSPATRVQVTGGLFAAAAFAVSMLVL